MFPKTSEREEQQQSLSKDILPTVRDPSPSGLEAPWEVRALLKPTLQERSFETNGVCQRVPQCATVPAGWKAIAVQTHEHSFDMSSVTAVVSLGKADRWIS